MYDAKREWLFLSDLEIDTNSAWLKTSLEMLKRPQEILVDDIRRAVEHEYVLRRCACKYKDTPKASTVEVQR